MPIVPMKAVTIAGPIDEFESIISRYLCDRDFHIENATSALANKKQLHPFVDENVYESIVLRVRDLAEKTGLELGSAPSGDFSADEMNTFLDEAQNAIKEEEQELSDISSELIRVEELIKKADLLDGVGADLSELKNFEFIKYQFGAMPYNSYQTLKTYLGDMSAIFVKTHVEERESGSRWVWGIYFIPKSESEEMNDIFSSLYFKPEEFPKEFCGVPSEVKKNLEKRRAELGVRQDEARAHLRNELSDEYKTLLSIYATAKKKSLVAEIKKKSAHSDNFFYVVGWMTKRDAKQLDFQIKADGKNVLFVISDPDKINDTLVPPTKLKNNAIFRPFEMFVKMYGLPSYTELDPTPVLALSYILFFGIMFGDIGQSAVLSILGFIVYFKKKWALGGIVGMVGLSGIIFGAVYGSVFGKEYDFALVKPMESINSMLIVTIGMGVVFILLGLILNVINSFKRGDIGHALFHHNGISGIVFYVSLLVLILGGVLKMFEIPAALFGTLIAISLICMYLSEPLSNLIRKRNGWLPKDGMFYVESLFELFEVVLSYLTNTISFLRIGAFAIVHVGMMMVVEVLSSGGGFGGVAVMVLGNILVMCLEGLIVGIQVLRLQYYEMFSRYFEGAGRPFVSINEKN